MVEVDLETEALEVVAKVWEVTAAARTVVVETAVGLQAGRQVVTKAVGRMVVSLEAGRAEAGRAVVRAAETVEEAPVVVMVAEDSEEVMAVAVMAVEMVVAAKGEVARAVVAAEAEAVN